MFLRKKVDITYPEDLLRRMQEWIDNHQPYVCWDRSDELSEDAIKELVHNELPWEFEESLINVNLDYFTELETGCLNEVIGDHKGEVMRAVRQSVLKSGEYTQEELDSLEDEDLVGDNDLRDDLMHHLFVSVDLNLRDLVRNTPDTEGFVAFAPKDVPRFNFGDTQQREEWREEFKRSALYRFTQLLQINPRIFYAKYGKEFGIPGSVLDWPDTSHLKPYVSMEDFAEELGNANVDEGILVFTGKIDLMDFYNHVGCKVRKVTVPAGNRCGIFDYTVGAGSLIEMKLLRDIEFEITEDGEFSLHKDGDRGYSIDETYGVTRQFWGDQLYLQFKKSDDNATSDSTQKNPEDS